MHNGTMAGVNPSVITALQISMAVFRKGIVHLLSFWAIFKYRYLKIFFISFEEYLDDALPFVDARILVLVLLI